MFQAIERGAEGRRSATRLDRVIRINDGRGRTAAEIVGDGLAHALELCATAKEIARGVARELKQPAADRLAIAEAVQALADPERDLGDDVAGVVAAGMLDGDGLDERPMLLEYLTDASTVGLCQSGADHRMATTPRARRAPARAAARA